MYRNRIYVGGCSWIMMEKIECCYVLIVTEQSERLLSSF